jgi:hypothetical protein
LRDKVEQFGMCDFGVCGFEMGGYVIGVGTLTIPVSLGDVEVMGIVFVDDIL